MPSIRSNRASAWLFASTASAILWAGAAHGQEKAAKPETGAPSNTGDSATALHEIIVTAQKRVENVQDVPIAVTAIGGAALALAGVHDTQDLQLVVPELNFASPSGFAQPYLRGIGSDINVPGAEASVATFVDGVYVEQQEGQIANLLGVDRIEVLAGPQGTLYGRNASGGAINVYSLNPSQRFAAHASASYGSLNQVQGSAYVSGGLTDTLSAGLYVAATRRDSIYDFLPPVPPGQTEVEQDRGARVKVVWQPTAKTKFTASIENTYFSTPDSANRNIQPGAIGYVFGANPVIDNYKVSEDVVQFTKTNTTTAIAREEVDLSFAQLVGITGYRDTSSHVQSDVDATNAPVLSLGAPIKSHQFSQEIQLLSPASSPISWIAGLYYFREHGAFSPIAVSSAIIFQPAPFDTVSTATPEDTTSYAGFAQATFPLAFITKGLRLTLGGRYTVDDKTKLTDTETLVSNGVAIGPPIIFPGASKEFSKFTPKATLEYKVDSSLLYFTYAQGWKSGTFNNDVATDNTPVNPETLTDYEGGWKSDFFDRRLRLDLAAYYYDLKNLQVQVLTGVGTSGLRNAAAATAYGLELSGSAAVTDHLKIDLSGAWEHTNYDSFPDAPYYDTAAGNTEELGHSATGHSLQRAPDFVSTASVTYNIPLKGDAQLDMNANVYYNSGFNWDPIGEVHENSYALGNAWISYTTPDRQWAARLWVNNIGDTYHRSFAQITSTGTYANDALPRTYGVTLTWNYR